MKQKDFVFNLSLLLFLNLLVKPFWILGVDVGVQNRVGAAAYGLYFSIFSFTMLFNMVLDMGTTNYNNRNIARNSEQLDNLFTGFVTLRMLLGVAYFAAVFIVALIIGYRGFHFKLLFWIALNQFLNAFLLYLRSNISALMMFKTDSVISVLDKFLMIVFCGILLWGNVTKTQFRIEWFVWSQTAAYLIAVSAALAVVLRKTSLGKIHFSLDFAWDIIKRSFPFALITLLMTCYYRIDSVMLERLLPQDIAATQSGIYASAFRLIDTLAIISYLFSVILLPLFSKMLKNREDIVPIVRTSFSLLALFSISAVAILFAYREPVIDILYKEHITESVEVFGLIIFGLIPISFTYLFGTLLTANGSLKEMNIIATLGIIVNIAVNLILVPKLGARGAAIASLCTQMVVSLMQLIVSLRIIKIQTSDIPFIRTTIFATLTVAATFFLRQILPFHLIVNLTVTSAVAIGIGFAAGLLKIDEVKLLKK